MALFRVVVPWLGQDHHHAQEREEFARRGLCAMLKESRMPTLFIAAQQDEIASTVIRRGDPGRAAFMAGKHLTGTKLVSEIRGIPVYTGEYGGKHVTVMASGMGMPSMSIYSQDLFGWYDVDVILRVSTTEGIHPDLRIRDLVLGEGACTVNNYAYQFRLLGTFASIADFGLLKAASEEAKKRAVHCMAGNLFCSGFFYDDATSLTAWQKMGFLAVEIESAALYMNAARFGQKAFTICTIADYPLRNESATPEETERTFTSMMEIALEIAQ